MSAASRAKPGKQTEHGLEVTMVQRGGAVRRNLPYLLFLPKKYSAKKGPPWPLMLFLHGAGERGSDLALVKKHGPPKLVEEDPEFPMVVAAPQWPDRGSWVSAGWQPQPLLELIDHLVAEYAIDRDRICLTGLSMGGYGVWATAAAAPDRFACAVPICGGGDPATAARLAQLPIWTFHGAKDKVVPLSETIKMVDAVRAAGGNVRLTVYSNEAHESWLRAYAETELLPWILAQRRS